MRQFLILAVLFAAFSANAGNDNANPCGNNGNNCNTGGTTNNQGGNGYGGTGFGGAGGDAAATGIGVGVGVGLGGEGGKGGTGGDGGNASAIGLGGNGGAGGAVVGSGNSNNRNDATAISGSVSGADSSSVSGASSSSGGNTIANGPVTQQGGAVSQRGGDTNVSYRTERNAPPVYLGNVAATVSCAGGFSAGSSSQGGAGALGFNWISPDCKTVVAGQNLQSLGMVDVACRVFKTTDGFKRAAKRDPSLNAVDCSIAK